ncbi:MAG: UMP kinase [Armatimonadota bacterium]|nr:UMP kinase [Armatimonadota bacterium]MCX7778209.1 UMP kinase [Armatimonadota bacterium]MDW8025676.1 UMP kinase [Armatimonadota bacterium]
MGDEVTQQPKYKRVLLKVSGEVLAGGRGFGIDPQVLQRIASEIMELHMMGVEMGIVIGGGNIFRGLKDAARYAIKRVTGDYIGMLATVINALALQDAIENLGAETRVMTAIEMRDVAEPYIQRRALRHLEVGRITIFAAGTGNPFFTTDTAASLRALQIGAEVVLKGTDVDGVFDRDPDEYPNARKFDEITHVEALRLGVKVLDAAAISLCHESNIPIIVFNICVPGNLKRVILGEPVGTIVRS